MAATPLTLLETSSNSEANTPDVAAATAGATRPTLLFGSSETLATSANPTTITTTSNNTANNAATSPSGGAGGGSSTASSPSFLPEMPQWKKDLIQRRKTNVARTIGAATVTPTSPLSDQQQQETDEEAHQATAGSTLKSTTVYQKQTTTTITTTTSTTSGGRPPQYVADSACGVKANFTKMPMSSTNAASSPPALRSPTKETTAGGHYTPSTNASECDRQDWSHDNGADALLSPTSESTIPIPKQRSLFLPTKSHQIKEQQLPPQQELEAAGTTSPTNTAGNKSPASGERTTTTTRLASSPLAPRETFGAAVFEVQETETTRKAAHKTSKSGTYATTERSQMQSTTITTTTVVGTTRAKPTTPTGASTLLSPSTSISTLTTTATATATATPNRPLAPQQQPKPHQFHSKYESERTLSSGTSAHAYDECLTNNPSKPSQAPITAAAAFASGCENNAIVHGNPAPGTCVKISSKLQNNQFIKQEQQQLQQQQQQQLSGARYFKHKSHSLQESSGHHNVPAAAVTGSRSVSTSESVSFSRSVSVLSGSGAGSPTKTTASTIAPTASAIKKKMVAVQEMKKTSQNSNHHQPVLRSQHIMGGTTCARPARPRTPSQTNSHTDEVEFDPAEDLSYGPGIVSKLRCRYLSLAYRESMEKERLCLDNMRRATSLNNLLDRDDHKDDDEDDEENGVDAEDEYVELCADNDKAGIEGGKLKPVAGGILKHSHDSGLDLGSNSGKKTATFQKHSARGTVGATNGTRTAQARQNAVSSTAGGDKGSDSPRSRNLKRGNDSLKRARSVEALLCERSPWNYGMNRSSYEPSQTQPLTPTCVTIEDKINNARSRMISGTDSMPPKRLTSVIEDTERPPPDLVKQTLKKFEATANRRGRGPNRTNGKGEVANKVANYKTIIMENKPPIVFPKPPLSPTKKASSHVKPVAKPVVAAADLLSSPLGRKATNATNNSNTKAHNSNVATIAGVVSGGLSEHSPDIIPRHKLLAEKSELEPSTAVVDSPVTAVTKKLEKLQIDANKQSSAGKESLSKPQQQQLGKLFVEVASPDHETDKCVGGTGSGGAADDVGDADHNASVVNDNKKHSDRAVVGATANSSGGGVDSAEVSVELDTAQAGTGAISSDLSDDENGSLGRTKRVTKTALENIARVGTTQQFKFVGQTSSKPATNSGASIQTSQPQPQQQNTNPDIPTSVLNASPGKQIGVIRPLLNSAPTTPPTVANSTSNSGSISNSQQQQQQHMEALKLHSSYPHNSPHSIYHPNSSGTAAANNSPRTSTPLTSLEIEKNRINEMKKTASTDSATTATGTAVAAANNGIGSAVAAAATSTSLNNVINTNVHGFKSSGSPLTSGGGAPATAAGYSEPDTAAANNSPLWALRKKRQTPPVAAAENTSMVFNFSNRKEVPDYIENDGVIFRRKRELPKPNESGFVLLGDLSVETSTDSDYDDFSMSPPSPCDVEFENANIVIDGKSSIRQKPKEATFRVQFNDTLTSTFEYPSEASLIIEESFDDMMSAYENLRLDDSTDSTTVLHHHHVAVDEIIQLPTPPHASSPANNATSNSTPTKNMLGNLPLGSAPLGFYTPVKAPLDNLFQLGVTRAPSNVNGHASNGNGSNSSNGLLSSFGAGGSIMGITDGLKDGEEPESLQYIKPANDDLTIAYSEGAQKTDLLY